MNVPETRCPTCAGTQIEFQNVKYELDVKHEGRMHHIVVPSLRIRVCQKCNSKIFDSYADEQVTETLHAHLTGKTYTVEELVHHLQNYHNKEMVYLTINRLPIRGICDNRDGTISIV